MIGRITAGAVFGLCILLIFGPWAWVKMVKLWRKRDEIPAAKQGPSEDDPPKT